MQFRKKILRVSYAKRPLGLIDVNETRLAPNIADELRDPRNGPHLAAPWNVWLGIAKHSYGESYGE